MNVFTKYEVSTRSATKPLVCESCDSTHRPVTLWTLIIPSTIPLLKSKYRIL